ncbi:MAG: hypothetical protein ABH934_00105 [Chloroflexota bacterium]
MSEIRYQAIETYDGEGNLIATESIPYEVSKEEMAREEAENIIKQLSDLPDAELTTTQLKQLVKALARLRR